MASPRSPAHCPICATESLVELTDPAGTVLCAQCGFLLRWFQDRFRRNLSVTGITPEIVTPLRELGMDSLDLVELIGELEDDFGITLPEAEAERLITLGDVIRYIRQFWHAEGI